MTPRAPVDPKTARSSRKREVSKKLAQALLKHDVVKTVAAAEMGTTRQRLANWAEPESERSLSVADMMALPAPVKKEMLGWIAGEMDMALVELPRPSAEAGAMDDVQLVAHVQRETSERRARR